MVASVLVKPGNGNLSVLTDETTSPERQRDADDKVAAELGVSFGEGDALREAVDLGRSVRPSRARLMA